MPSTRGVILAAGRGSRLGAITEQRPKPLVTVAGRPLIAHTIEALAAAGVRDLIVVPGYRRDALARPNGAGGAFGCSIEYVDNPNFEAGNGRSLACALGQVGPGGFLVTMADHLPSRELLERVLDGDRSIPCLGVDRGAEEPWLLDEATKVRVAPDGRIVAIGKDLEDFDGVDTGVFYLLPDLAGYAPVPSMTAELSAWISAYLRRPGGLFARDVTGCGWHDVDTAADLLVAGAMLRERRTSAI